MSLWSALVHTYITPFPSCAWEVPEPPLSSVQATGFYFRVPDSYHCASHSTLSGLRVWQKKKACFQQVQSTKVSVLCVHLKSYPCVHVAGPHWDCWVGRTLLLLSVLRSLLCKGCFCLFVFLPCHRWQNLLFIVSVKELPPGTAAWHCRGCCGSGISACSR